MFNWKVEEMKLMNTTKTLKGIYYIEYEVSREDKIAFVDSMQDGKLSYIIGMIQKFESERDNMPKDQWGHVKTVSLKAWLKRNDTGYNRPIFNNDYYHGSFRLLDTERNIQYNPMNTKGSYYDKYEDLVNQVFHSQLVQCEKMEKQYFLEHDEYSILKKKFRELSHEYGTTFGIHTGYCSNGEVYVYDKENHDNQREITIEELRKIIPMYDRLDMFIQELSEELDITYEKPIEDVKLIWECTDPDCMQYQKNYGNGVYHMIQMVSIYNKETNEETYDVINMAFNINDYDDTPREELVESLVGQDYYKQIKDKTTWEDLGKIIAKYIFEDEFLSDDKYILEMNLTEDEAKKYIQEYIKTR